METDYYWRVLVEDSFEHQAYSVDERMFSITSDVKVSSSEVPDDWALSSVYPNPFNSIVNIKIAVPVTDRITLEVFDILGRMVYESNHDNTSPGYHRFYWRANGSSGIYLLSVSAGSGWKATTKLLFIK